ncbi:hypothetical protein C8R45DRAFT_921364 [Mycena sanguinolenta]|nr:hypothetical protein C8R45DRAFT_921364 [Mycena sanguinolenta]
MTLNLRVVLPKLCRPVSARKPGICPEAAEQLETLGIETPDGLPEELVTIPPELSLKVRYDAATYRFGRTSPIPTQSNKVRGVVPRIPGAGKLFAALGLQPLLPQLHTLVIHLDRHPLPENCDAFWTALVPALATRHIQAF